MVRCVVDGCGGGLWANGEGSHQNRELILGLINQYNSIFCILLLLLIFFDNAVANVVIKVNTEGDGWELWKPRLLSKLWTRKPEKPKALRVPQLNSAQLNKTQLNTFQFKTLICAIEENTENSFLKLSFFLSPA